MKQFLSRLPGARAFRFALTVWRRQEQSNLSLLAAGIAFFSLLSIFPAITASVAIGGLILNPDIIAEQSETLTALLPDAAQALVLGQLNAVVGASDNVLGAALIASLSVALYSASRAVANMIIGLNVSYDCAECRGFFHLTALKLGFTAGFIVSGILALGLIASLPAIANIVDGAAWLERLVLLARWPILAALAFFGISALYQLAPDRRRAGWRWITPGAGLAGVLWLASSVGFSSYVQSFGTYNETFGALGGVIILLTWLWISAYVFLLGAVFDAEWSKPESAAVDTAKLTSEPPSEPT